MPNATLSKAQRETLLKTLQTRFEKHPARHKSLEWAKVQTRLEANPQALRTLHAMEETGGEPDVIGPDHVMSQAKKSGQITFCDCSAESPQGRRSVCYDREGQQKREAEGIKMVGNVLDMAAAIGIEPLTEEQYRELQTLGAFDTKTQSWLQTPTTIYKLGGAIFADRRFDHVFVYHNTAPSFYRVRGFRGLLRV